MVNSTGKYLVGRLISQAQSCTTIKELKRIHAVTIRHNLRHHGVILAKMLRFAAVSPTGDLHYACLLFSDMPRPNAFFFNMLIRGFAKSQTPLKSMCFFSQMLKDSIKPDGFTWTFLLKACSRIKSEIGIRNGNVIHGQALKFGFLTYLFVQNSLIHFYAMNGLIDNARVLFDQISEPDVVSWSGLVMGSVRVGDLDVARKLFDEMPERDVVSWTNMITGYQQEKKPREALDLFEEMGKAGILPDEVTLVSVISACSNLGDLQTGLRVHRYIKDNGFEWMISLCNALIDMYSKCGCLDEAKQLFLIMPRRSLITWNSMISAFATHGKAEEAFLLFERMEEGGIMPDDVTFLAILSACAHKGWINEGLKVFDQMLMKNRIIASLEHYGCMVDMLGRAGMLDEAYELIMGMPISSNDVIWGALLSACRTYGDVNLGEKVLKKLIELKPEEGGYYLLLCDIYAATGRIDEMNKMRRVMKDMRAMKTPGCSWVDEHKHMK